MADKGSERIDVVYLWVDGTDPVWRSRRQAAYSSWAKQHASELAIYGNVEGRYRDNGELRYSLRALETFFPAHGHVHIVTDGQCPEWLHRSERVSIVDHRDLIPPHARPVFDSGHIESYVHHIRGLSERFLYLNDDVFFGAPVQSGRWFGKQLSIIAGAEELPACASLRPDGTATGNAALLSRAWLSMKYPGYRHEPRLLAHAPRPFLKSALHALEECAADLFRRARSTVFRTWDMSSLISDLAPRWMAWQGIGRFEYLDTAYICSGDDDAEHRFANLKTRFGTLPFFCINDTCDDARQDDPRLLRIGQTLEGLLPRPSSFEHQGHAAMPADYDRSPPSTGISKCRTSSLFPSLE